ncbi:hypothetical protein BDZ45DRAFT_423868 [Acephala macrosclerotiorum]|nr:hypothetical protein BDZ45DRAFT_423868 [Acephala macrosclerotiorum]
MSGNNRPSEMIYLEEGLNFAKAKLFQSQTISPASNTYEAKLAIVARTALVYDYLDHKDVSAIFKKVSNRVLDFLQRLDSASAGSNKQLVRDIRWANGYSRWIQGYLPQIDGVWQNWKDGMIAKAKAQIEAENRRTPSALLQALLTAIDDRMAFGGELNDMNYECANSLLH